MSDPVDVQIGNLPDNLRQRPGGGSWRTCELEAARMRAEGFTWPEIADVIGFKESTVRNYTQRVWWTPLFEHYRDQVAEERARQRQQQLEKRREEFREVEHELVDQGTRLALLTLIATMRGTPPKDDEGEEIGEWPDKAPSWQTKALAARDFLKVSGYEHAKKYFAEIEADLAREAAGVGDEDNVEHVDIEIEGVHFGDDDDGDGAGDV